VPASFTRVEPLKARITHTANGYPAELGEVRDGFGQSAMNAPDEGWFWIFATPGSAKRIRRDGHKVVGSLLTTWIPPQDSLEVLPVAEPPGQWRPMYDDDDEILGAMPDLIPPSA
jgi:hypothetical protein